MSDETSLQDLGPLLQNLVDYLAKLKDPNKDLQDSIRKIDRKIELLIKRTESVTVGLERLIAVIEDTFAKERAVRRADREPRELPKVRHPDEVVKELQEQLGEVKQEISDLQFTFKSGFIENEEYQTKLKELRDRRKELRDRIKEHGS
jgi:chromosome segregation ATPase